MTNPHPEQEPATPTPARLADIDPDLLRLLSEDDRAEARRLPLLVLDVSGRSIDVDAAGAFAGLIMGGTVAQRLAIGDHWGLRVLGPGDVVTPGAVGGPMQAAAEWEGAADTRIALLRDDFLLAARRWPGLYVALYERMAAQAARLATQLAICQLPRVEERLIGMLWLLADSFGRVTGTGTLLPLSLTHEALGAMIGARRSTVTLALGELAHRGAVVRQDRGLLLLELPPQIQSAGTEVELPAILDGAPSDWFVEPEPPSAALARAELAETVVRMRAEHVRRRKQVRERLRRTNLARARAREVRDRVRADRELRSRQPPSS